ncbi:hypothetical protein G6011_04428 [Alternaria panax]|uniref:Uncharacterized protein n=1 Tax=Alternaria panax TaxID=48097 RepID=A0AAD4NU06_9PLEO|nr:hypothetical protein G6011_04428 [Alternaria panax]
MSSLRAHSSAMNDIKQSSLASLHSSTFLHAVAVVQTHAFLCEVYCQLWQSIRHVQYSNQMFHQMFHQINTCTNSVGSGSGNDARQYGPPDPEPPAAPPIIILSRSGKAPTPHFQVPDPADQQVRPQPPTSSLSLEPSQRELGTSDTYSRPPTKPEPEPHPAPPVIILSDRKLLFATPPPSPPTSPISPQVDPAVATHAPDTMGSKVSKVKEQASNGKLQPSQERLDKEQMKEPSNYYTHRSKSMRRKAGKTGASSSAGGAQGGTAGGAGGGGIA